MRESTTHYVMRGKYLSHCMRLLFDNESITIAKDTLGTVRKVLNSTQLHNMKFLLSVRQSSVIDHLAFVRQMLLVIVNCNYHLGYPVILNLNATECNIECTICYTLYSR